jgi:hypothetical protein
MIIAVASDMVGAEAPLHLGAIGIIIALVAALRLQRTACRKAVLRTLEACVATQPAVHATAKLIPHGPLGHGTLAHVGAVDVAVGALQVALALAIVAGVAFIEEILGLLLGLVRLSLRAIRFLVPAPPCRPPETKPHAPGNIGLPSSAYPGGSVADRGPPVLFAQ